MQVCNYPSSPCGQGTDSSFYRSRGGGLQSYRTVLGYVWRYGAQCHGVDGRHGESCLWRDIAASLVLVQERFEGSGMGAFRLSRRPYAGSRV
jgi:hypothetical protein